MENREVNNDDSSAVVKMLKYMELKEAMLEGDIESVRDILAIDKSSIIPKCCQKLLRIALKNDDLPMVKFLLKHGAKPDPVLPAAILKNQYMIIQELIRYGADANRRMEATFNSHSYVPLVKRRNIPLLCLVIQKNDESLALMLVRNGADINAADSEGDTVLSYALHQRMRYLATELISMGCDINTRNRDDYTILHVAVMSCLTSIMEILLNKKADQSHPQGKTLLHLAAASIEQWLSTEDSYAEDVTELFEELLVRHYDVNAQDTKGDTPLHAVVHKITTITGLDTENSSDIAWLIKALLLCGADVTIRNAEGHTPVSLMTRSRRRQNPYLSKMTIIVFDPIFKHIVLRDLTGKGICEEDIKSIKEHEVLKKGEESYKEEVEEMRQIKFNGTSIAEFFSADLEKIAEFVNDPTIAKAFRNIDKSKWFPSFENEVQQIWQKAEKMLDWLKILFPIFQGHIPIDMILEISNYLLKDTESKSLRSLLSDI